MSKEDDRRRAIERRLARMDAGLARRVPLATGFAALDAALGAGGIPRGSIVELFGPPDSGKTTLALQIAAHAQRSGHAGGWMDADRTFDPGYAAALGIALDRLPIVRPDSAEQAMAMLHRLASSCALDFMIIDTAAALVPALELEIALEDQSPGLQTRVMASTLQKLARAVANSGVAMIFLNQMRTGKGRTGENRETSAGGSALKLYAAIRIVLNEAEGGRVRFRVLKNHAGRPFAAGELVLRAAGGFVERP